MNKEKFTLKFIFILVLAFTFAFMGGCTDEPQESINNPSQIGSDKDPPEISDVQPESALAGVSKVEISGENFSANPEENLVFFNAQRADIIEATETKLTVLAPNEVGDSVKLKVAIQNVELFSKPILYQMNPAVNYVSPDIDGDRNAKRKYYGITIDGFGNVYASITEQDNVGQGITQITPEGERLTFAEGPAGGPTSKFDRLRLGPNNKIYCANNIRGIFLMKEGATDREVWASSGDGLTGNVYDMDFSDENGDVILWAGSDDQFFSITQNKEVKTFDFAEPARTVGVRVYDGYVYFAIRRDEQSMVVRYEIISKDEVGEEEVYFTFDSGLSKYEISGITFDAEGTMYAALNSDLQASQLDKVILKVYSDGSYEDLYPRLISGDIYNPKVFGLRYGEDNKLYFVRKQTMNANDDDPENDQEVLDVIWIDTTVPSAPHYGR